MNYQLPHTIENETGERITFLEIVKEPDGDKLLIENSVRPGAGPPFHTHFLQEESLTVVRGRIGYQENGGGPQFAGVGETVTWAPGVSHKFWNAGEGELHCKGYIKPANTFVFFLSSVYAAQDKSGSEKPEIFDASYLLTRYSSEYRMDEIPWFVRKVLMPVIYVLGRMMGKYKHFKDAPKPIKH